MILLATHKSPTYGFFVDLIGDAAGTVRGTDVGSSLAVLRRGGVSVAVCERDLPGGGWTALLAAIEGLARTPLLIVTSADADERLWAEVLNLGGYDVLAEPYDPVEVVRIVARAQAAFRCAPRAIRLAYDHNG